MNTTPHPKPTSGLRHVALFVTNFDACIHFYTELLGMKIEWQPDADNIYLTSGNDNLALHRATEKAAPKAQQKLEHIGFIINEIEEVDVWHQYLAAHQVQISKEPKTHRDGARSFYCADPDGNSVQMMYHPPLANR